MKRSLVLAILALAATSATGCTGSLRSVAGAPSQPRPSGPGGATPRATSPAGSAPRTLVLTSSVREQLITAWMSRTPVERADIAGTNPGLTFYGIVPSTRTYWAVATFVPTDAWKRKAKTTPDRGTGLAFQDGPWVFSRQAGRPWRYVGDTGGMICPAELPDEMIATWGLSTDGCS